MECCDCLFTPIFDPDASWELPPSLANYYTDYNPLPWNGPSSYLSRAWCRLEMLYASQIPLYPHSDKKTRDQRFTGRLHHHAVGGHRPHVLYGSFESRMTLPPIVMPPLPSKLYPKFDPMEGHVTAATDKDLIARLCMHLHDHHSCVLRMGYSGETDDQDLMHGHGTYRYENGDVYVGDWAHGMKHGIGVFTSGSGEVYEGEYNADHRVGLCKFRYKDGCIYYGEMSHGKKHGRGVLEYPNGDLFEGLFRKDRKEGHGVMRFTGGNDFYDGEYKRDKKHGQGVLKVGNTTQSGQFRDDSFEHPPP